MNMPKISIITITYNSEKTVRETFESIRRQRYSDLEYIVVDGGSIDSTLKIADEYRDIITSITSEPDSGISDAMNKGITRATGDLIGIIHSDDMLADDALNILAEEWDEHTDVFYGNSFVCDEQGNIRSILCAQRDLSNMVYSFCMVHPSTFVTKQAYNKYGLFDKSLKCAMDFDLLSRFYLSGAKFKYINKELAFYRTGGTNMKYRSRTIHEVRNISINHGGKKTIANMLMLKKIAVDRVRPLLDRLSIHSGRSKKV